MSVIVTCDREGCGESAEIERLAPLVHDQSGDLKVYLPEGWEVDTVCHEFILHCPEHAEES